MDSNRDNPIVQQLGHTGEGEETANTGNGSASKDPVGVVYQAGVCALCGKSKKRRFYFIEEIRTGPVCGYCVNKRLGCRAT